MTPQLRRRWSITVPAITALLMTMAGELAYGTAQEVAQLDEKLYLESFQPGPARRRGRKGGREDGSNAEQPLPVVRVAEIAQRGDRPSLARGAALGRSSVGVIGGAPKCAKTWLGLDMALSVATGHAVPGQVRRSGGGTCAGLPGGGRPAGRPPAR